MSWIISAFVIRNTRNEQKGILPFLPRDSWRVHLNGLAQVLELLASHMFQNTQGNPVRLALDIQGHEKPGFAEVINASLISYQFEGLDIM